MDLTIHKNMGCKFKQCDKYIIIQELSDDKNNVHISYYCIPYIYVLNEKYACKHNT